MLVNEKESDNDGEIRRRERWYSGQKGSSGGIGKKKRIELGTCKVGVKIRSGALPGQDRK